MIGSSKGARDFLSSQPLRDFLAKNPQIDVKFMTKRGHHPYLNATYINGFVKDQPLRNYEVEEILKEFMRVRNSCKAFFENNLLMDFYSWKKAAYSRW